jgi:hypothetical protein
VNTGAEAIDEATLLTEIRWTLTYQFSPAWALRTGFEALLLDGVGLATDQVNATENLNGAFPIDFQIPINTVYYYGAFLGLEYNF